MDIKTKFSMDDRCILIKTGEEVEVLIVGIKVEIYEDGYQLETYNVRTGNGQKFFGFNTNELEKI